jgi:hypothetical protein
MKTVLLAPPEISRACESNKAIIRLITAVQRLSHFAENWLYAEIHDGLPFHYSIECLYQYGGAFHFDELSGNAIKPLRMVSLR